MNERNLMNGLIKKELHCNVCGFSSFINIHQHDLSKEFKCDFCLSICVLKDLPIRQQNKKNRPEARAEHLNRNQKQQNVALSKFNKNSTKAKVQTSASKLDLKTSIQSGYCDSCNVKIPKARLEAVPNTKLCINCANNDPSGSKNRKINETWGSRDDWKRDWGSWRKRS